MRLAPDSDKIEIARLGRASEIELAALMEDIGANLTHSSFREDLDAVLARSREAGVQTIIVTGTSVGESGRAAALADAHPGQLYATAGVHPHRAS